MDLADPDTLIRERREALGSSQSGLARFNSLSRRMMAGLEACEPSYVGVSQVPHLLSVLGLDLEFDPPSQAARSQKRGLWMAARTASVSYVQVVPPDTLGRALVSGSVPTAHAAHLIHLPGEAPVPLMVMAVEEAAANEDVAPEAGWRNVAKLARSLAVRRQGLWAS